MSVEAPSWARKGCACVRIGSEFSRRPVAAYGALCGPSTGVVARRCDAVQGPKSPPSTAIDGDATSVDGGATVDLHMDPCTTDGSWSPGMESKSSQLVWQHGAHPEAGEAIHFIGYLAAPSGADVRSEAWSGFGRGLDVWSLPSHAHSHICMRSHAFAHAHVQTCQNATPACHISGSGCGPAATAAVAAATAAAAAAAASLLYWRWRQRKKPPQRQRRSGRRRQPRRRQRRRTGSGGTASVRLATASRDQVMHGFWICSASGSRCVVHGAVSVSCAGAGF